MLFIWVTYSIFEIGCAENKMYSTIIVVMKYKVGCDYNKVLRIQHEIQNRTCS